MSAAFTSGATNINTGLVNYQGDALVPGSPNSVRSRLLSLSTVRGRIGYAVDRALIYATAGLAYGRVKSSNFDLDTFWYNHSTHHTGWVAGAGIEYALGSDWSIKSEGLYYKIGKNVSYSQNAITNCQDTNLIPTSCGPYSDKVDGFSLRLGLNYRFDVFGMQAKSQSDPASVAHWNGFYLAALAGSVSENGLFTNSGTTFSNYFDPGDKVTSLALGVSGGVQAGYNVQIGAMVAGLVTDYSFTSASGSMLFGGAVSNDVNSGGGLNAHSKLKAIGTTRVNLGYAVDKALIYATGGLAYGQINSEMSDSYGNSYNHTTFHVGWAAGGGLAYSFNTHWSAKVEGLYYRLANTTGLYTNDNQCNYYDSNGWNGVFNCGPYTDAAYGFLLRSGLAYRF